MAFGKAKVLYRRINVDRIVEKSMLFDFYGELLTQHQKKVYSEYIQNDLSVTEMAGLLGISRQGAHDMIRRCEKIMRDYESRLQLVSRYRKVKKMVAEIQECAEVLKDCEDRRVQEEKISRIATLSGDILEEY